MKSVKGIVGSEFKVGSIVYFISDKTEQVIPALVSEKIMRSSLDCDTKVTYVLKVRQGKSFKSIEVDPLQTTFFEDTINVKSFMMERTTRAIDKLVATAVEASKLLKPAEEIASTQVEQLDISMATSTDEPIEVTLPDGKVAKFRM
jgi:hypothetical protein